MNEEDLKMADADKAISILILSKWYDDVPKPKQKEGKRVCFSYGINFLGSDVINLFFASLQNI